MDNLSRHTDESENIAVVEMIDLCGNTEVEEIKHRTSVCITDVEFSDGSSVPDSLSIKLEFSKVTEE